MLFIFTLLVTMSNSQTCPNWDTQNIQKEVNGAPDPNWLGAVGGGRWRRNDFPQDPLNDEVNQNFTWIYVPPSGYVYIDSKDPKGQEKFDNIWATQNMSEKLKESPRVRPAGYKYGFIRAFNKKVPCISVEAATGHGLEIAVFAEEDHRICIRDKRNAAVRSVNKQASVAFTTVCNQQRVKHCFVTPNDQPVNFEIYADTPYELTNGFGVFYRLRRSRYAYDKSGNQDRSASTEMWCMMLDGIDWPEFGATTPNGLDIPPTNGAPGVGSLVTFVCAIVVAFVTM